MMLASAPCEDFRRRFNDVQTESDTVEFRLSISFSSYFPTKASPETAKCRQINRFQSSISSFPSFGRGFDSHRPLHFYWVQTEDIGNRMYRLHR